MLYSLKLLSSEKRLAFAIRNTPVISPLYNDGLLLNVLPFIFLKRSIVEAKSLALKFYKALLIGASYSSIKINTFLFVIKK